MRKISIPLLVSNLACSKIGQDAGKRRAGFRLRYKKSIPASIPKSTDFFSALPAESGKAEKPET